MSDDYSLRIREAMIQRVHDNDMLTDRETDSPEYARGIAEFIAVTTLLSTEDGIGHATENILPQLWVQNELAVVPEDAQHFDKGYAVRWNEDRTVITIVRDDHAAHSITTPQKFDMQDAADAARKESGWTGIIFQPVVWTATGCEWRFKQY